MQAKGMMRGLLVGLCLLAATATAQLSFLGVMNPENGDFGGVPFPLRSEMETFLETDFSGNLVAYGYYMPTLSRFGFLDPVATDPPSGAALEFDTSSLAHPEQLPYKFIGINFNPGGHPGAEYLIPHFDVHFYTKPSEFIRGIVCSNSSFPPCFTTDYIAARFAKTADSTLYPAGYENSPAEWVPAMGAHLVPNPIPATFHTVPAYIFGSYNGELIFHEPMISSQVFLASETTKQVFGWPTTQAYPGPGRFFSRISIEKVTTPTERYKVTLDGLVTAPESHNDVPIFMGSYIQGTAMVATNTLSPTKDCLINNGIDIDGGFTVDSAEGQFCCRIRGEYTGSACVRDTCVGAQPISATFFSSGDKCYAKCAARV